MIERTVHAIFSSIAEEFHASTRDGVTYLRTPFVDLDGDAIELALEETNGSLYLDDGGRLAALLFELDQETEGSAGFKLVSSLAKAHGMQMDFDEGSVKMVVNEVNLGRDVWLMAQVVASVCQALPHFEFPQKGRPSMGPRLRRRVRSTLRKMRVLDLVEQRHRIAGKRVDGWIIDFFYRPVMPPILEEPTYDVVVNTVDLDVADPIPKAEHAITLAMDVKQGNPKTSVRVIYDTHSRNSESEQASQLIVGYKELGYDAFNYQANEDYSRFTSLLQEELFPEASSWFELRS